MIKAMSRTISAGLTAGLFACVTYAAPVPLSDVQMDSVAAGGVTTVDGFVCPVITTDGVLNSPKGAMLPGSTAEGGVFYTIGGPDVTVPVDATNGDGASTPGGTFLAPGDVGYSAIWGCCR